MSIDPSRIVGYNVYQTTNPDFPKEKWVRLNDRPMPDTHFVQDKSQLKPGVTYYTYVTAVNALGIESEPSEVVSLTIPMEEEQDQSKQAATVRAGQLPKKITPTPVKEAITEIRFTSKFPADAIFGIVYNEFKTTYSNVEKLPILQLPEVVRANDPAFIFQPYYRLRKRSNFLLGVGPKVLSLVVTAPYPGWTIYLPEILRVFTKVNTLGFIENVTRAAIRYVDFFKEDIFQNINLRILMNDQIAPTDDAYFRTVLGKGNFQSLLQVANNARIEQLGQPTQIGSLIDVDTFRTTGLENFFSEVENYFNEAHFAQKELFFSLLKPEFLAKFNPEYDN